MRTSRLFPLAIVLLITLTLFACSSKESEEKKLLEEAHDSLGLESAEKLPFSVIEQGDYQGYGNKETEIIKITDEQAWQTFWASLHKNLSPLPSAPLINFDKDMVIAVLDAEYTTPVVNLVVQQVEKRRAKLVVMAQREKPVNECMTTMALTQPFVLIRLAKQADEADLVLNTIDMYCE